MKTTWTPYIGLGHRAAGPFVDLSESIANKRAEVSPDTLSWDDDDDDVSVVVVDLLANLFRNTHQYSTT